MNIERVKVEEEAPEVDMENGCQGRVFKFWIAISGDATPLLQLMNDHDTHFLYMVSFWYSLPHPNIAVSSTRFLDENLGILNTALVHRWHLSACQLKHELIQVTTTSVLDE